MSFGIIRAQDKYTGGTVMGIFDFFKRVDINTGVQEFQQTKDAVLLDVRTSGEYREGHIPGSKNLDVSRIRNAGSVIRDKHTPLFVYCYSGSRSAQATSVLKSMGYTNVNNIGGISGWRGKIER
jgi:phage shock protein E